MSILHRSHGNNPEVISLGLGSLLLKLVQVIVTKTGGVYFFLFLANHHHHWQANGQDLVFKERPYVYPPGGKRGYEKVS